MIKRESAMTYKLTTFDDLTIGQKASLTKKITEEDLSHFIAITGDMNPLHVDESFAEKTFFGQRIAHGMLSASLFSTLVGLHIPGIGAIYKSQTLEFLRPVFIGDTLCAWFEIVEIDRDKEEVLIKSWIENQDGKNVIEGQTVAGLLRGMKK
jgi:3-hydroxybutyryl-CoA dehydratase